MTDVKEFVEKFFKHEYDPVKAREYYLRTRKLKGRGDGTTEYEKRTVGDAQKKLNSDLKKTKVTMNPKRRIDAAEQKLIRARSLASRIKDPAVKADMLARLSGAEKKLKTVQGKHGVKSKNDQKTTSKTPNKSTEKPLPKTQAGSPGKPHKPGQRFEEDESPMTSPGGARLTSYDGGSHGLGKAVYSDGHVYDAKLGWIKPQAGIQRANAAQAKVDRLRKAVEKASPARKAVLSKQLSAAQKKLNAVKASTKSRANQ